VNWLRDLALTGGQIDLGREIGIIHRNIVRNIASPSNMIAFSSPKGDLKPKGNLTNRWCCVKLVLPSQGVYSEVVLSDCDGGITRSSSVFLGSKGLKAER